MGGKPPFAAYANNWTGEPKAVVRVSVLKGLLRGTELPFDLIARASARGVSRHALVNSRIYTDAATAASRCVLRLYVVQEVPRFRPRVSGLQPRQVMQQMS